MCSLLIFLPLRKWLVHSPTLLARLVGFQFSLSVEPSTTPPEPRTNKGQNTHNTHHHLLAHTPKAKQSKSKGNSQGLSIHLSTLYLFDHSLHLVFFPFHWVCPDLTAEQSKTHNTHKGYKANRSQTSSSSSSNPSFSTYFFLSQFFPCPLEAPILTHKKERRYKHRGQPRTKFEPIATMRTYFVQHARVDALKRSNSLRASTYQMQSIPDSWTWYFNKALRIMLFISDKLWHSWLCVGLWRRRIDSRSSLYGTHWSHWTTERRS